MSKIKSIIIERNVGIDKRTGHQRIYLDPCQLKQFLEVGAKYTPQIDKLNDRIFLKILPGNNGEAKDSRVLTVSRRKRKSEYYPVIDFIDREIEQFMMGVKTIKAVVTRFGVFIYRAGVELRQFKRENRLFNRLVRKEPLKTTSICSGLAMLDYSIHEGLRRKGIASGIALAIEQDKNVMDAAIENGNPIWNSNSVAYYGDLSAIEYGFVPSDSDILTVGIPCVASSKEGIASKGLDFAEQDEKAGNLFFGILEIFKMANPAIGILECVPEFLTSISTTIIRSVLKGWGYILHEAILNGNSAGALENRRRMVVVAVSAGVDVAEENILLNIPQVGVKPPTVSDILEDVPLNSDAWRDHDYLKEKLIIDKKKGNGFKIYLYDGNETSLPVIKPGYFKRQSGSVFIKHPVNPNIERLLSKYEHALAKTAPHWMIDSVSESLAHKMLGNGVIVNVFIGVAMKLGTQLLNWIERTSNKTMNDMRCYAEAI